MSYMRKSKWKIIGGGLAFLILLLGVLRYAMEEKVFFRKFEHGELLQSGDIVLLGSQTWRGRIVRMTNSSTCFAHVAMVEQTPEGCFFLHADPEFGCIAEDIQDYFANNKCSALMVLRPQVEPDAVERALAFSHSCIRRHLPFNQKLKYGVGKGLYCTEFVLKAYEMADEPLLTENLDGKLIRPEELLKSARLREIETIRATP